MIPITNPLLMLLSTISQTIDLETQLVDQGQHVNTWMSQLSIEATNPRVREFLDLYQPYFYEQVQMWSRHEVTRTSLDHAKAIVLALIQLSLKEELSEQHLKTLWSCSTPWQKKWLLSQSHGDTVKDV
jgi:hypothetical protein